MDGGYVLFGQEGALPATLELSQLNRRQGVAIQAAHAGDRVGHAVSGAGDVNGDGIDNPVREN